MKFITMILLMAVSLSASATDKPSVVAGANAGPNTQSTEVVSGSVSSANNGGQSLTYAPVYNTPANTTAVVTTNGTQVVEQKGGTTVTYAGSQTVNQNVSGGTTNVNKNEQVGVIKQEINGTTTNTQNVVASRGTNSSVHQTFGSQTIKNTPSVSGPPLTASNDTCMGSASGSVNAPGFGLSLGKTYTDANCVMLKNARELWNMGMKGASMALMCQDKNNREALEVTGFSCPARKNY